MLYIYFSLTVALQVVCAIDGCEFRIQRPHDDELEDFFFSAKKKQNSINVIFIVLLDGRIIYKSKALSGDFGDQSAWNFTKLRDKFVGKNHCTLQSPYSSLSHRQALWHCWRCRIHIHKVGDKGNVIGVTPYSNKYGNTLTEEQREDKTNIARIRVIVENVFALLKKWECLSCMCYPIVSVTPLLTVSQQAKADMLDSKT